MTFSYNISLPTALDQVRFLIGDTVTPGHEVEDEEITGILALRPDPIVAACLVATSLMSEAVTAYDALGDRKKVGRLELESKRDAVRRWRDVCDLLNEMLPPGASTGAIFGGQLVGASITIQDAEESDADVPEKRFSRRNFPRDPVTEGQ